MKKKVFLTMAAIQAAITQTHAAGNIFGDPSSLLDEIKGWTIPILVGVLVISGLFNMGNFIGDKRDVKAGVYSMASYVLGTMVFLAVIAYISSQSVS